MDKNTITGFILIAVVLVVFSFLNRPSQEQLDAQKKYYDSIALVQQKQQEAQQQQQALMQQQAAAIKNDSTALFFNATQGEKSTVTLKNELLTINLSTKGGNIESAVLHKYNEQDQKTPITLFNAENASINYIFDAAKMKINSSDYYFQPVDKSDTSVVMRLMADANSYIDFKYTMHPNSYLVDLDIKATNMSDKLAHSGLMNIEWNEKARQLEKGYKYENRLSELMYNEEGEGVDNLSNAKAEEKTLAGKQIWIAFKNQFFSSVMISNQLFEKTTVASTMMDENSGYIKNYTANTSTFFDPYGTKATKMFYYIGPNQYKTLTALDKGKDYNWKLGELIYLGWPVVKQINKWFIVNIFDWMNKWGLNMGIVLLLLTILVKIIIFPTTWKTFKSSAKMKALKPKLEELNKKYPNKEDAMRKQQEMMSIYRQYDASPMGGCVPMLIQFPILMAMFMFVPSAIEFRQQHFLWSNDLSTYDTFIHFPFHVPLLGDHLSLFCLLMTITSILTAKFTMQQQDNGANSQMAAMKWFPFIMPIMFLFILNDYPAGLNFYYFLSTLITVLMTLAFKRMYDEKELLKKMEANKKDPTKMKKSGFAARLEQIQKMQEDRMKQQNNKK